MGPVPCQECERSMSSAAVVCPHCGTRQTDRDPVDSEATKAKAAAKKKPLKLSAEETAALLEAQGVSRRTYEYGRMTGPAVLLFPRAESVGWVRTLEWALTLVALPMILGGLAMTVFRPRMWRWVTRGSELGLSLLSAVFGGLTIWSVASFAGWSDHVLLGVVGASAGALVGRLILRALPVQG